MNKKRALVIGRGGSLGAYSAGVLTTLCRNLGPAYFDAVYASSIGVFIAAYFVANQPDIIEIILKNFSDGTKVVNFMNPLKRKEILNIDYYLELFKNKKLALNLQNVFNSTTKLYYTLTSYPSGQKKYCSPNEKNIFDLMKASGALPFAHKPVKIGHHYYIDGGLADPLPVAKASNDGFKKIVAVSNYPAEFNFQEKPKISKKIMAALSPKAIGALILNYSLKLHSIESWLKNTDIIVIRPLKQLPLHSILDTNKERLAETFDLGMQDGYAAIKKIINS